MKFAEQISGTSSSFLWFKFDLCLYNNLYFCYSGNGMEYAGSGTSEISQVINPYLSKNFLKCLLHVNAEIICIQVQLRLPFKIIT